MTASLLALPRVRLLPEAPTPLQAAPRLSEAIGLEVWLKRDDLTGFGLGGNKVRGLEYLLADAEAQGCDCLVTGAGPQSNWAMLAALAARVRGLDAHLVYYGDPVPAQGNHRLALLAGAQVRFTHDPERASVDGSAEHVARELRQAGRRPYVLPRGGAVALGAVGYVRAALELTDQLLARDLVPHAVWLAAGSCSTQAGLLAGARWLALRARVVGVTVSRPADECRRRITDLAAAAAAVAGLPAAPETCDVEVVDGTGAGYGRRSQEGDQAAELVARTEGVFLDPVFGAKAMAALVTAARDLPGPVVFLCTGGAPTLFAAAGAGL